MQHQFSLAAMEGFPVFLTIRLSNAGFLSSYHTEFASPCWEPSLLLPALHLAYLNDVKK